MERTILGGEQGLTWVGHGRDEGRRRSQLMSSFLTWWTCPNARKLHCRPDIERGHSHVAMMKWNRSTPFPYSFLWWDIGYRLHLADKSTTYFLRFSWPECLIVQLKMSRLEGQWPTKQLLLDVSPPSIQHFQQFHDQRLPPFHSLLLEESRVSMLSNQ